MIATVFTLASCAGGETGAGGESAAPTTAASETTGAATEEAAPASVTITDNHGEIEVPVNPERVVALDNHVFQTLSDWGIELVAAPKGIMGTGVWPAYTENDAVLDIGNHGEPDLEQVVAAEPDLIIGGYRFASYYDQLKEIQPVTIELAPRDGEDQGAELVRQIEILGQIFDREDEAAQLVEAFESAIEDAKSAYDGTDTAIGLITSGGEISYAAPGTGRSVGVLFPTLGLVPAIEQVAEDETHGDDISLEAIAQANPDWLIVLDRDGALDTEGYVAAKDLIEGAELLQNVTAVQQGQIVYLDPSFYLTEDIQSYTALYEQIAQAFSR